MYGESIQTVSDVGTVFQPEEVIISGDERREELIAGDRGGEEIEDNAKGTVAEHLSDPEIMSDVDIEALNKKALKLREERVRVTREIASLKANKLRSDILKEKNLKREEILRQKEMVR